MVLLAENEYGEEFEGFLLGNNSRTTFEIAINEKDQYNSFVPFDNANLSVSWYKMQSGRYEINAYIC